MKYPIGTKLEYIFPEEIGVKNPRWKPCGVVVGESLAGRPIVQALDSAGKGRDIFELKEGPLLRRVKVRTEWWSRIAIDNDGEPFALQFCRDKATVDSYESVDSTWHGEAFSIIVETETAPEE